jgi:hypothetical protein
MPNWAKMFLVLMAAGSCARAISPPGGPTDMSGPQVIATVPDTFSIVESFDGPIRITFNERISERGASGSLDQAVQISPESGSIEVGHKKNGLEIRMEGGFLPNLAYRVTVLPTVRDLFGNPMPQPFEFIFSTGADLIPNALAGMVSDRLTGRPMGGVRVTAILKPLTENEEVISEELMHVAISESDGIFAFRYLPPLGNYVLTAFDDFNRNKEIDFFEPFGNSSQVINGSDTVFADISLLSSDTTAAVVSNADVVDSVTVIVGFDDYLNPETSLNDVLVEITLDSIPSSIEVQKVMHEREYLVRAESIEDSVLAADSIRAVGDSVAVEEFDLDKPRPSENRRVDETRDLPKQTIYILLSNELIFDQTYKVFISGVTNINGIKGDNGTAEIYRSAPATDSTNITNSNLEIK